MDYPTIKSRHSVRAYTSEPIADNLLQQINAAIDSINTTTGLNIQLVTNEPKAFGKSIMAHYGKFSNVANYICLIGNKNNDTARLLGYWGEHIVLLAQSLGLNSCWVGLSFSKGNTHATLGENEKLYAVIAIGHGQTQGTVHKIKQPNDICKQIADTPKWFQQGVDYALLAPTALNQQKFKFEWLGDNNVKASTSRGFFVNMDLGIAMYHFEIGAKPTAIKWIL
jgi:hypothetical protein